jgi:hypothetical protein
MPALLSLASVIVRNDIRIMKAGHFEQLLLLKTFHRK